MAPCRFQAFLNAFRCALISGQHCEGVGGMRGEWVGGWMGSEKTMKTRFRVNS